MRLMTHRKASKQRTNKQTGLPVRVHCDCEVAARQIGSSSETGLPFSLNFSRAWTTLIQSNCIVCQLAI